MISTKENNKAKREDREYQRTAWGTILNIVVTLVSYCCHKHSSLKQHKLIILHCCRLEKVQHGLSDLKSMCWEDCVPPGGSRGRICVLAFSSSWTLSICIPCLWSPSSPFNASISGLNPSDTKSFWPFRLPLSLIKTHVITLGPPSRSGMVSPSQDPQLTHICKVPVAIYGNTFIGSGD